MQMPTGSPGADALSNTMKPFQQLIAILVIPFLVNACTSRKSSSGGIKLLNVSYDPTREFYAEINPLFEKQWHGETGGKVTITQSHGGSGKQARAVLDGLAADVVTLALAGDIDILHQERNLLAKDWQTLLPDKSAPYTSTIVFVVRSGNPKGIKDWADLATPGVQVITPNPKTSGGARWNYLAAWAWAEQSMQGDREQVLSYMKRLFANVPVLDAGARASTTTFAQRGIGDVFLSWENEAHLIEKEFPGKTTIIYPSLSILAEPPVAVVSKNTDKHGSGAAAQRYLEFLYTAAAQEVAAKHYYRPRNPEVAARFKSRFPEIPLVTIDSVFGGWAKAQKEHFDDGGTFDLIYQIR
jgi:sulfate transport system substrate-binding protein